MTFDIWNHLSVSDYRLIIFVNVYGSNRRTVDIIRWLFQWFIMFCYFLFDCLLVANCCNVHASNQNSRTTSSSLLADTCLNYIVYNLFLTGRCNARKSGISWRSPLGALLGQPQRSLSPQNFIFLRPAVWNRWCGWIPREFWPNPRSALLWQGSHQPTEFQLPIGLQ